MATSGVVFNGGYDMPPADIETDSSSQDPIVFVSAASALLALILVITGARLVQRYKKWKTEEAKRRRTEEELARAIADAQREKRLMSIIFHELRNPLNGVVAHLRLGSQSPEESAERLRSALVCTDHALSFLNSLSHIEKLEASAATTALRLEPCSLYEVVESVIAVVLSQIKPGVEMLITWPPKELQMKMDRTILAQILINLLQNAAAHTSSGYVQLVCSVLNPGSLDFAEVELTVQDTGSGMSEDMQTRVFDRYHSCAPLFYPALPVS